MCEEIYVGPRKGGREREKEREREREREEEREKIQKRERYFIVIIFGLSWDENYSSCVNEKERNRKVVKEER